MEKNRKRFKTDSKQKRDERHKKTGKSQWGPNKSKTKKTDKRSPVEHWPSYDVKEIRIARIKIIGERRALNQTKLKGLAKSIALLGLQSPITVRPVELRHDWGNAKREFALVSGLHRLEAVKQLGNKTIPCHILMEGKRIARMSEIAENLHRAELTPLEHDEHVAEWVRLTEDDEAISGHKVQKKGRGRPKGGISQAARKLPIKGKTHAAKRKTVERALKVAGLSPEVKEAAKKAGLDNIRSKLLKVAAEKTIDAQLAKVRELTARKPKTRKKRGSLGAKQKTTKASKTTLSAEDQKALEHLLTAWHAATPKVREQFIAEIRGA